MTMASLPKQCRAVLEAPAPVSEAAVTIGGNGVTTAAAALRRAAAAGRRRSPISAFTSTAKATGPGAEAASHNNNR